MKIKQMCMLVLLWLGVIPAMQAQTFDKLWKEVEQAEKKKPASNSDKADRRDLSERRDGKELSANVESVYVADEVSGYADS